MAIPTQSPSEELISSQHFLFGQIKRSHRLFIIRFWVLFIISILAFGLIAFLFYFEDESSIPTFFMLEVLPIIIIIRSFKENWTFLRWSGPYLKKIEESGKTSAFMTGLTVYVNRLYRAAFLDLFFRRENPDLTPPQFLEEIQKRYRLKFIVVGVVIASIFFFVILFILQSGPIEIDRTFASPLFSIIAILLAIIAILIVMFIFQAIWMRSLKQWVSIFQELDEWGKKLERAFLKSSFEGKGGA